MTFTFYFPLLPPTQRRQHPKAESKFYGFKRRKMAANDAVFKHDLQLIYQPHEGATFRGTYKRIFEMPQTTNERFIIAVESTNPFAQALIQISSSVLALCQRSNVHPALVWKGVTGPMDGYTDYWLWVEPDIGGFVQEGCSYDFMIEKCTAFQCPGGSFSYGVSIKARVILPVVLG